MIRIVSQKWVIFSGGMPVGLDSASGGYPFRTLHPDSIKYWDTTEEAQGYIDVMTRGVNGDTHLKQPRIVRITLSVEE